jgi:uncharacterized protein YjbI with pentapeptide repeats
MIEKRKLRNFVAQTRLRKWLTEQWNEHPTRLVGFILLTFAILFGVSDMFPGKFFEDFSANIATETASIAITVLIIDALNERRHDNQLKAQLIRDLGSRSYDFAIRASVELTHRGWHADGTLHKAYLPMANLSKVNFGGADLQGSLMAEADLQEAYLAEANLDRVNFQWAKLQKAVLVEASLNFTKLETAFLNETDLNDASLQSANLWGANLEHADLRGANLLEVVLESANLQHANLQGAYLKDANLGNANLSRADLSKTNLRGAILSGADLSYANFLGADITDADLTGAILDQAKITKEQLAVTKSIKNASYMLPVHRGMLEQIEHEKKNWAEEQTNIEGYETYMVRTQENHERLKSDIEDLMGMDEATNLEEE